MARKVETGKKVVVFEFIVGPIELNGTPTQIRKFERGMQKDMEGRLREYLRVGARNQIVASDVREVQQAGDFFV